MRSILSEVLGVGFTGDGDHVITCDQAPEPTNILRCGNKCEAEA